MDISAKLTRDEVASLRDPVRTCDGALRTMENMGDTRMKGNLVSFEESIRVKNTLDIFEEMAREQPSWPALAVLANCEYRLFVLNQATPLRNNPFLSHWVEAVLRLGNSPARARPNGGKGAKKNGGDVSDAEIRTVRVELIKNLLLSRDPSQFAHMSPKMLYENFVELGQTTAFDVGSYIQMLQEEGIYDGPGPHVASGPQEESKQSAKPRLTDFQQWKQDILFRLVNEPELAIPELTHLPLELSYLDFLTTLLQEKALQTLSIEPAPVISDYIQHALRLTEKMGQPPDSAPANGTLEDHEAIGIDHGREAQTRAVKLLLLFIKNLIRKALIPPEAIYFEIQEICVRYVWIREVRQFRKFVEEGALGNGDGN